MSPTTARRYAKQLAKSQVLEQQTAERIEAEENYTQQDRNTAETLEASEMLRAFLAEEL